MIKTMNLEYHDGNTLLEGFYAYDDQFAGQRPIVLIAHDWSGRNEFACDKAKKIAELGYVGFAIDMYGKGKIGQTVEEKVALMTPLKENRIALQQRILAALSAVQKIEKADTKKIAAIGFCFGGLCVLDLARSGADISGVVSFHGLLDAPSHEKNHAIKAKVLALHGHNDPMATPEQVLVFEKEMTQHQVDWQLVVYGNTVHAFMNPQANDPAHGLVYSPVTSERAWLAMQNFLQEIFK